MYHIYILYRISEFPECELFTHSTTQTKPAFDVRK